MLRRRPPVDSALKQRARELRNHMTQEEKKIWYQYLNHCGYSFKRQYVIPPLLWTFIARMRLLWLKLMVRSIIQRRKRSCMIGIEQLTWSLMD